MATVVSLRMMGLDYSQMGCAGESQDTITTED